MNKLSNEVKIGLIVLAAIFVAYIGFRIMKDEPFFSNSNVIYTKFETVEGLIKGSNIYLNGFKVGTVKEMRYLPEVDSALITLNFTEPIRIPVGSKAQLAAPDLLGSSTIRILKSRNTQFINWGDQIEGVQKAGLLDTFSQKGASITDSVSVTLSLVNEMLRAINGIEQNSSREISETITNFKETSEILREIIDGRKTEVDAMIADAQNTISNLSELSDSSKEDLQNMIANLEKFSSELDTLSEDLASTTESLNSILSKIDTGEGTLGKFINDPSVYNNLDSLTVNLNELIKGIQEDPGKYLKHMRLVEIF